MMIRQLPLETLDEVLLIHRATLGKPIGHFVKKLGMEPFKGYDDVGYVKALVLSANGDLVFMLSKYVGHNRNETLLSLPITIGTRGGIDAAVGRVLDELAIPFEQIVWQQAQDDPPRLYA